MQPSKITICRDKVTAPPVGQPESLDSRNISYKVMSGIQFEVTSNHYSIKIPKQLRMHGNTGQHGVEDSCEEFPIQFGKMIQVVRVGYDKTLGGFTYISFAPKNSPTIEFG